MVEGRGATLEEARDNALSRAAGKVLGEEVHSVTILENDTVKEVVSSLAAGHVHGAEVLSVDRGADGSYIVRVIADVRAGMLVAAFRSSPKIAATVLVPEANRWRDEAVSLRRLNADAQDFTSVILDLANTFQLEARVATPQRVAITEDAVVLETRCTVTMDWEQWNRMVVQPMLRLLASFGMPSSRVRCSATEVAGGGETEMGFVGTRMFDVSFECSPASRPLLVLDSKRRPQLFSVPPGVMKALIGRPRQPAGVPSATAGVTERTAPDRVGAVVLECVDASGNVILSHRADLPHLVLFAGRSEQSPAALLATNGFIGVGDSILAIGDLARPKDRALAKGRFQAFEDVNLRWRWKMTDEQLARFREVRARVEWR